MTFNRAAKWALVYAGITAISLAQAQPYPSRPIRFIVLGAAGGATDLQGRMLAEQMTRLLGNQVIVDNRSGAGGRIGMEVAARATSDGHTILFASQGNMIVKESGIKSE